MTSREVTRDARPRVVRGMNARPTWTIDASEFRPTPSQWRFLRSSAPRVMFSGGYGAGKSRTGAEKVLDLVAANPGVAGLVVSPTYQMGRRTTREALRAVFPRRIYNERAADKEWECVNGARIYFGSADKPGSLEGTNVGWSWIDEARLVEAEAWRTIVGRVRDRRAALSQVLVTTTPAMGWLYDEFGVSSPGRERIVASTRENAHNLAPGFVDELERTFTARQARALLPQVAAAAGLVAEWPPLVVRDE
jgi:phage terminase large subunit-like protein